ncbi:hypothetical protein H477_3063 [[Clostridium] sordellii ATCC 9714]|nr:hypothetical protein H477_3063 [[Clostridium] sordellii ATCC 9714] [Paeniclostridium sordellii ATCC 9714]
MKIGLILLIYGGIFMENTMEAIATNNLLIIFSAIVIRELYWEN